MHGKLAQIKHSLLIKISCLQNNGDSIAEHKATYQHCCRWRSNLTRMVPLSVFSFFCHLYDNSYHDEAAVSLKSNASMWRVKLLSFYEYCISL